MMINPKYENITTFGYGDKFTLNYLLGEVIACLLVAIFRTWAIK